MVPSQSERPEGRSGPLRRVVGCFDGSGLGERALPHALAVASALGAPLTLLRVLECPTGDEAPADPLQWEIRRREAHEYLDSLGAQWRGAAEAVDSVLLEGKAAEEICRWGADHEVDLTVVTSHGAGGHSPWSLASTARKLLDRAPGSFLIVPSTTKPSDGAAHYRRVLVPLDGSAQAETALPIATRIAAAQQSELIVAHVVPVPELTQFGPPEAEGLELVDRLRRRNERVARAYLDRLRAQLSAEHAEMRVILLQGNDVAGRIVNLVVREQVELVVLAAHGRSARLHLPCGSVAAELIARSRVPLLVVRSRTARAMRRIVPEPEATAARLPRSASP